MPVDSPSGFELQDRVDNLERQVSQFRRELAQAQAILGSVGQGIYTVDSAGRLTSMNAAAERILGWRELDLLGRNMHEIVHLRRPKGSFPELPFCPLSSVLSANEPVEADDVFARQDGTTVRVSYTSAPIREAETAVGAVVIFQDATERYAKAEALVESERQSRLLFEQNPFPMWVFDVETLGFLDVNPAAVAHYGYSREEFLAMTLRDIRPAEDVRAFLDDVQQNARAFHAHGRWRHRKKNGRITIVEVTSTATLYQQRPAKLAVIQDITDREQSEEALRQSENRYQITVETASDVILTVDENSTILFVNQQAERIFGYTAEELTGKSLLTLIPDRFHQAHLNAMRRYLATGKKSMPWTAVALPGRTRAGSEVPLEVSFGESREGDRTFFTGVMRDVSERRRAEERIRESIALVEAITQTAPLAIYGIDLDGNVTFWNSRSERLFGWTLEEATGKRLPIIPTDEMEEFEELLLTHRAGGSLSGIERLRLCKNGSLCECEVWSAPLRDAAGSVMGTVGILVDITERKRQERSILESEQNFRQLFADNPQPMWVFDTESLRFLELHDAAVEHYGYSREEFLAMTLLDIRPPEEVPRFMSSLQRFGDLHTEGVWSHRLKNGRTILVEVAAHRIDLFGRSAVLSLVHDVTERKRAEEQLGMYIQTLARSNSDLKQFAYAASHDLQEPIRGVSIFTQLLTQKWGIAEQAEIEQYSKQILEGAKRIQDLVEGLRHYWELSEVEHRSVHVVNAEAIFQELLEKMHEPLKSVGATVHYGSLPLLAADESALRTVCEELRKNAVRFRADRPSHIAVSAHRRGKEWQRGCPERS